MELKIARTDIKGKPKTITYDKILSEIKKESDRFFYFDKSNAHKDLVEFVEKLEEENYRVFFKEVRYGLDEDDYMYQVHIL